LKKLNKDKIIENLPMERLNIDIFNEIDSTNDEAKRINLNKDFHIIIAEKQYKGRGRLGKKWSSPDLGNIYMTVCSEKDFSYMPLSLVVGVICKKGIEKLTNNNEIKLKWPNDILYNNKKVGGILVEKEVIKESTRTIIGIGINLNIKKEESWWGDLSKYELETKRNKLINLIISEIIKLDRHYDWIDTWRNGCAHLNKEVEIYKDEEFIKKVIFKDIDEDGNGILQNKNGHERISSGQISIKGIY
jgi:BirA family biotin operon repressor/biotin-[acetyl-CoA-carboxylase] ligase